MTIREAVNRFFGCFFGQEFNTKAAYDKNVLNMQNIKKFKEEEKAQKEALFESKTEEKATATDNKNEETAAKAADQVLDSIETNVSRAAESTAGAGKELLITSNTQRRSMKQALNDAINRSAKETEKASKQEAKEAKHKARAARKQKQLVMKAGPKRGTPCFAWQRDLEEGQKKQLGDFPDIINKRDALSKDIGEKIGERQKLKEEFQEEKRAYQAYQNELRAEFQRKYQEERDAKQLEYRKIQLQKQADKLDEQPHVNTMTLIEQTIGFCLDTGKVRTLELKKGKGKERYKSKKGSLRERLKKVFKEDEFSGEVIYGIPEERDEVLQKQLLDIEEKLTTLSKELIGVRGNKKIAVSEEDFVAAQELKVKEIELQKNVEALKEEKIAVEQRDPPRVSDPVTAKSEV